MNRIHRLVWNHRDHCWVVTHEHATSRGKPGSTRRAHRVGLRLQTAALLVATAVAAVLPAPTFALPTAPTVAAGNAAFNTLGKTLTVTNSNGAIINWNSFSIGAGETTKFLQPSAASQVLNRVTGGNPSQILGSLRSEIGATGVVGGKVFLINQNGIAFGKDAQVNVGGLVVSTLALSDADFLANKLNFTATPNAGKLTNEGHIETVAGGQILLVAPSIENTGILKAPNGDIMLAAGKRVSIVDINHPEIEYDVAAPATTAVNLGQISARRIGVYAGLIDAGGTLDASAVEVGDGGRIILKANDTANVSGTLKATGSHGGEIQVLGQNVAVQAGALLDASGESGGGKVLVGGDYQGKNPEIQNAQNTTFAAGASINVDATKVGAGGTAIVWADDTTRAYGNISARGGVQGGDGGFVEVSGKRYLDFNASVDTRAPNGKQGTLLLDPSNITIGSTADINGDGTTGDNVTAAGIASGDAGTNSLITAAQVGTLLGTTNISLAATNDITLSTAISKSGVTDTTLTLIAGNNVNLNANISASTSKLNLMLVPDSDSSGAGQVNLGAVTLNLNGGSLDATGKTIAHSSGTATLNNVNLLGGILANSGTGSLAMSGNWSNTGTINLSAGTLDLGGSFTTAGIGSITRSGGAVTISGAWTNSGQTYDLNGVGNLGNIDKFAGTIIGGEVMASGGATITSSSSHGVLDGVTLGADLLATSGCWGCASVTLKNGVMLSDATITLNIADLRFDGTQTLGVASGKTGTVDTTWSSRISATAAGYTGTFGSGLVVQNSATSTLDIGGTGSIVNEGMIEAKSGTLTMQGAWSNLGTLKASGGTLALTGTNWSNAGTIDLASGTLNLGGSYTTAGIGTVTRGSGSLTVGGIWTNSGQTYDLNGVGNLGNIDKFAGTIIGGEVMASGGATITSSSSHGVLDGVTLGADLLATSGCWGCASVTLKNGLMLSDATITLNIADLRFDGTQTLGVASGKTGTVNTTWAAGYLRRQRATREPSVVAGGAEQCDQYFGHWWHGQHRQ